MQATAQSHQLVKGDLPINCTHYQSRLSFTAKAIPHATRAKGCRQRLQRSQSLSANHNLWHAILVFTKLKSSTNLTGSKQESKTKPATKENFRTSSLFVAAQDKFLFALERP